MVPVNLSKGSGLLLLSCCSRSCGSSSFSIRPLLPFRPSPSTYYHSDVKGWKGQQNMNWNNGLVSTGALSLSRCVVSTLDGKNGMPETRLFCTASNIAESSSPPTTSFSSTSSPSSNDNEDRDKEGGSVVVDMIKIKELANTLDIRVGRILKAWRHEEADSLYVEEVDIGEPEARIICSGLVKYVPLESLQDKHVVVLANLKARNMRGVKSFGMLMAASDESHENVELLEPPEGSLPGERVWFGSEDERENLPDAATPNAIQKKKIWEQVQPHLHTDASGVAALGEHLMRTSAGPVFSKGLKNANIS